MRSSGSSSTTGSSSWRSSRVISIFLGWKSTQLAVNANFERMIPSSHPYIKNFLDNKGELRGLGNQLRVVVENTQGDIFDPDYLRCWPRSTTSSTSCRASTGPG